MRLTSRMLVGTLKKLVVESQNLVSSRINVEKLPGDIHSLFLLLKLVISEK